MTIGQSGDPEDISGRVARGFEALVDSEQGAGTAGAGAVGEGAGVAGDSARVANLEERVRQTMDALTELVQAHIPVAVDSLRDELETMRVDLQSSLNQATGDLAQERQELRAQIAKTVGAANKWFVKARDQLLERLDEIAAVAAEAEAKADEAAKAATAASASASSAASVAAAPAPAAAAIARPRSVRLVKDDAGEDGDEGFEWDVEDESGVGAGSLPARRAAASARALAGDDEMDVLMEPVRDDIQELQGEISAMGQAVAELRAEVAALAKRVPARPKPVRLDERDIDVIVEAILVAVTPPPPVRKAAAKKAPRSVNR